MKNKKIRINISPDDIYNKLSQNDKEKFNHVEILNATLWGEGNLMIECLLLENEIEDDSNLYLLFSDD